MGGERTRPNRCREGCDRLGLLRFLGGFDCGRRNLGSVDEDIWQSGLSGDWFMVRRSFDLSRQTHHDYTRHGVRGSGCATNLARTDC